MSMNPAKVLHSSASPFALAIDRWIWVFMAAFYIAITLAGFIPDSIIRVGMVQAGMRPPFLPILHVHAVLMGSFLLLLLAQAMLMATGRRDRHKLLGRVAFVLVPALVIVGFILAPASYQQIWHAAQAAHPPLREQFQQQLHRRENIALMQILIGILFPVCIGLALRARRTDPGFHKRMMFLATALPLPAAFDRIAWLPTTMPASQLSSLLYVFLAVSPMFLWDVIRNRTVHRAYRVWLGLYLPFALVALLLWDTPGWHAFASQLLGP